MRSLHHQRGFIATVALCVWLAWSTAGEGSSRTWRAPVIDDDLLDYIARHECVKGLPNLKAYRDSKGIWTIGYGHNLDSKPISAQSARQIFLDDVEGVVNDCIHAFPWFLELTKERQKAVIDLVFNMGIGGVQKFHDFTTAMSLGEYNLAAGDLLFTDRNRTKPSQYALDVKGRARDNAALIRGSENI